MGGRMRSREWPVRRLTREECDLMGFAHPLVLSRRQYRWIFGPWRSTKTYVVHSARMNLWAGTLAELLRLGVDPDSPTPEG
jgi:hypothetical protein